MKKLGRTMTTEYAMTDLTPLLRADYDFLYRPSGNYPIKDFNGFARFILTRVIPMMDTINDYAFYWNWEKRDLTVMSKSEYKDEIKRCKSNDLQVYRTTNSWYFDYTLDNKTRRCILKNELWFDENAFMNEKPIKPSPLSILLQQHSENGHNILKCSFKDL